MREIRNVYDRWLRGELSQEDTLFAIGDLLEKGAAGCGADQTPADQQDGRQAVGRKTP
jgi:hypothetical protein